VNIAQHLAFFLLILLNFSARAQDSAKKPAQSSTANSTANATSNSTANSVTNSAENDDLSASQKSLYKPVGNKDFNKPLYFDQIDNGLILPPLELDYDLAKEGKELRIGSVFLNDKTLYFKLAPLEKSYPGLSSALHGEGGKNSLLMAWPDKLISAGSFEVISKTGAVLWKRVITKAQVEAWSQKLDGWRKALGPSAKNEELFSTQFAILDAEKAGIFTRMQESFRFCLSQEEGHNTTKICSRRYAVKKTPQGLVMGPLRADSLTPRVLVNSEEAPLKRSAPVALDMPTAFYSELTTGESYEFIVKPNKLQLMDIADTQNPKLLRVVGYDTRPIGPSTMLNPVQYNALTKMIGFESTIGDPRKFWAANIPVENPQIFLPGQGGGIFRQRFELSEIPRRQSRIYLNSRTPIGTYIDGIKLEGRKQPTSEVTSTQNSVILDQEDPSHFYWKFRATERGQINRSYLDVNFEGKTYHSYYEIYKGYPRELSARLSAVSVGSLVFLGEIAYNQWFEDLFGWTNYYVSRQRWGFSAKYFRSFNDLKVDGAGRTAPLNVLTLDLKYRLIPGLWNRDETLGILGSYQNVTFDKLKAPMLGAGAFWARSMPKSLDDLFNLASFLRYPKWVDMEFIYYTSSLDSNVTLNSSMALNFHGKVMWTNNLFGEAGFGYKRYAFTDSSLKEKAELNTFYGTLGVGLNF